jgi:hypothetical protein
MSSGHVQGQMGFGLYSATIAWIDQASMATTDLAPGRYGGVFGRHPRFPAWRCLDCKIVEFSYEEKLVVR